MRHTTACARVWASYIRTHGLVSENAVEEFGNGRKRLTNSQARQGAEITVAVKPVNKGTRRRYYAREGNVRASL